MLNAMLSRLELRFSDAADEERFRQDYCVRLRPQILLAGLLGVIIYYVFFIWDQIIDPATASTTHAIRGAVAALGLVIVCVLALQRAQAHLEALETALVTMATLSLTLIYTIIDRGFEYGGVGILLITLFTLVLFRLRMPYVATFLVVSWGAFLGTQVTMGATSVGLVFVNALVGGCTVFFGLFATWNQERDARRQFLLRRELTASKKQIEELVHSMLPEQIVERMRSGEKNIADSYGEVSIVFADLVGFTQLSRRVAPHHLVEILNNLFTRFDELAAANRVEKIKTIGDAYMAVCGMGRGDSRHAERAAEFAFGMLKSVEEVAREVGFPLDVRIGLHVGPVIAGVIGTRKPAFDCWGDSVNIASRLESSGVSGGIQISETARWRLQHKYRIVEKEELDIKGIGRTKTYAIFPQDVAPVASEAA